MDEIAALPFEEPSEHEEIRTPSAYVSHTSTERRYLYLRSERLKRDLGWVASAELVAFEDLRASRSRSPKLNKIEQRPPKNQDREATLAITNALERRYYKLVEHYGERTAELEAALNREPLTRPSVKAPHGQLLPPGWIQQGYIIGTTDGNKGYIVTPKHLSDEEVYAKLTEPSVTSDQQFEMPLRESQQCKDAEMIRAWYRSPNGRQRLREARSAKGIAPAAPEQNFKMPIAEQYDLQLES